MKGSVLTLPVLIAVLLLALTVHLALELKVYLKKKFYSYTNIGLIAGIIFLAIFFVTQLIYIVEFALVGSEFTYYNFYLEIVRFPSKFSYLAVPVIVIICSGVFVSNIALIRHEGFRIFNLLGAILGGAFVVASLGIDFASRVTENMLVSKLGPGQNHLLLTAHSVLCTFAVTLLCYFECIYFATIIMAVIAVKHRPNYDKDFMIILGCSIDKRGGLLPLLKSRTNRAIKFAWEQEIATGKSMRYIPSGGQGPNEVISEGSAMEMYLLSHGAESYEVFPEKNSRNTYENFAFSKRIIEEMTEKGSETKTAFATTNYHILRSGILARYAGLDAEGIASETKWYFWPNGFIREFVGIIALKKKAHIKVTSVILVISIALGVIGEMLLKFS